MRVLDSDKTRMTARQRILREIRFVPPPAADTTCGTGRSRPGPAEWLYPGGTNVDSHDATVVCLQVDPTRLVPPPFAREAPFDPPLRNIHPSILRGQLGGVGQPTF
jgi:hypothetical protein